MVESALQGSPWVQDYEGLSASFTGAAVIDSHLPQRPLLRKFGPSVLLNMLDNISVFCKRSGMR